MAEFEIPDHLKKGGARQQILYYWQRRDIEIGKAMTVGLAMGEGKTLTYEGPVNE